MYSRKFEETSIPENYAGNAFDREEEREQAQDPASDPVQDIPPRERKRQTASEHGDGDILIPLIVLWLSDRGEGRDLTPLLLLLLLWES